MFEMLSDVISLFCFNSNYDHLKSFTTFTSCSLLEEKNISVKVKSKTVRRGWCTMGGTFTTAHRCLMPRLATTSMYFLTSTSLKDKSIVQFETFSKLLYWFCPYNQSEERQKPPIEKTLRLLVIQSKGQILFLSLKWTNQKNSPR